MLPLIGLGMIVGFSIGVMFQIKNDLGTWKDAFVIMGAIYGMATFAGIAIYCLTH